MANYINEDSFFKWYDSVSKDKRQDRTALLGEVYADYCKTHKSEYVVPASHSVSGKAEKYEYDCDIVGCCGANTVYIRF